MVDIRPHHYSWVMERWFLWLSSNPSWMDLESTSLVANRITSLLNSLFLMALLASSKPPTFIEGGVKYFSTPCISQKCLTYCRMPNMNGFTMELWIYLTWSWKTLWCFFHMLFPNSNQIYFLKLRHLSATKYISPDVSTPYIFAQVYICFMVTYFFKPSIHWSPEILFANSLHSTRTILYFLSTVPLRRRCVNLTLSLTFKVKVIFRCLNTLFVRSCIAHTILGPVWSNLLMQGKFLFTWFCLVARRILSWIIIICEFSLSLVLSPVSIL